MSCERSSTTGPRGKSPTTQADLDLEANQGQEPPGAEPTRIVTVEANETEETQKQYKRPRWYEKLVEAGVEENGIRPVALGQRKETQYNKLFTVFFTCLLCVLPYVVREFSIALALGIAPVREFETDLSIGCQPVHLVLWFMD